jgi:hypothetical protein
MNGSGTSVRFTSVRESLRDEILVASSNRDALAINNQGIAALHDNHVFVEVMHVWRRRGRFPASPECHLAPVHSIKDVPFYPRSRLTAGCDPVGGMLHEIWEIVHSFAADNKVRNLSMVQ